MPTDVIRVLIVDDIVKTRENIKRLLQFESDIVVVGEAGDGQEAISLAKELDPDCILMDVNMPGMDGIAATEQIHQILPDCVTIIISVQDEIDYLRRAMLAGAREYLAKPFTGNDLVSTIRRVWERKSPPVRKAKLVIVFSAKGGVGKTTIATNLAVALSQLNQKVILWDLDLQFGDIPIMLDLNVKRTVVDWYSDGFPDLNDYLLPHETGVNVLAAPEIPGEGELITAKHISDLITKLQPLADYVIVDTPQFFHETTLQSLELADEILLVANQDLPNLKNVCRCHDVLRKLGLDQKVKLVVNKVGRKAGLEYKQFQSYLSIPIWWKLTNNPAAVESATAQGIPLVELKPDVQLSREIIGLGQEISGIANEKKNKLSKVIGKLGIRGG